MNIFKYVVTVVVSVMVTLVAVKWYWGEYMSQSFVPSGAVVVLDVGGYAEKEVRGGATTEEVKASVRKRVSDLVDANFIVLSSDLVMGAPAGFEVQVDE